MHKIVIAAAALAALAAPAAANQIHDASIDAAAARIVAGKIGDLRGGFAPDEEPVFVDPEAALATGAVRSAGPGVAGVAVQGWDRGLARAREPHELASASF